MFSQVPSNPFPIAGNFTGRSGSPSTTGTLPVIPAATNQQQPNPTRWKTVAHHNQKPVLPKKTGEDVAESALNTSEGHRQRPAYQPAIPDFLDPGKKQLQSMLSLCIECSASPPMSDNQRKTNTLLYWEYIPQLQKFYEKVRFLEPPHQLREWINTHDLNGRTPLKIAARNGVPGCISILIALGASPGMETVTTAFHEALFKDKKHKGVTCYSVIQELLEAIKTFSPGSLKAIVNLKPALALFPDKLKRQIDERSQTILASGNTVLNELLCQQGMDTSEVAELARLLLRHGADPLIRNATNEDAFSLLLSRNELKQELITDLMNAVPLEKMDQALRRAGKLSTSDVANIFQLSNNKFTNAHAALMNQPFSKAACLPGGEPKKQRKRGIPNRGNGYQVTNKKNANSNTLAGNIASVSQEKYNEPVLQKSSVLISKSRENPGKLPVSSVLNEVMPGLLSQQENHIITVKHVRLLLNNGIDPFAKNATGETVCSLILCSDKLRKELLADLFKAAPIGKIDQILAGLGNLSSSDGNQIFLLIQEKFRKAHEPLGSQPSSYPTRYPEGEPKEQEQTGNSVTESRLSAATLPGGYLTEGFPEYLPVSPHPTLTVEKHQNLLLAEHDGIGPISLIPVTSHRLSDHELADNNKSAAPELITHTGINETVNDGETFNSINSLDSAFKGLSSLSSVDSELMTSILRSSGNENAPPFPDDSTPGTVSKASSIYQDELSSSPDPVLYISDASSSDESDVAGSSETITVPANQLALTSHQPTTRVSERLQLRQAMKRSLEETRNVTPSDPVTNSGDLPSMSSEDDFPAFKKRTLYVKLNKLP